MKDESISDFSGFRFLRNKRVFRFLDVSSKNDIDFVDADLSSSPAAPLLFSPIFGWTLFDGGRMQELAEGKSYWDENFDLHELNVISFGGEFGLIWQ